jgi:hypothetical protein
MKTFARFGFSAVIAGLLVSGCDHTQVTKQSSIQQSPIQISNHFAEGLGYHLTDYYAPKVEVESGIGGGFRVIYEPKVPLFETNYFYHVVGITNRLEIIVDPKTGAAKKVHLATPNEIG